MPLFSKDGGNRKKGIARKARKDTDNFMAATEARKDTEAFQGGFFFSAEGARDHSIT